MPKAYDTWTVLPHRAIEKLEPNLWRIEGDLPNGRGVRTMTVVKLASGGLLIHSAIALEEELMKELEAFGKPEILIVPSGFHRLDAKVYKQRYPGLRVLCPPGARKRVEQVIAVDGTYDDGPSDDTVRLTHLDGAKNEGAVVVKSPGGTSVVLNDIVFNVPKIGGVMGFMMAPTGRPAVPRLIRWMLVKDRARLTTQLEQLADLPELRRVIVSHGSVLTNPREEMRAALSTL
jgi:hypothetical protein